MSTEESSYDPRDYQSDDDEDEEKEDDPPRHDNDNDELFDARSYDPRDDHGSDVGIPTFHPSDPILTELSQIVERDSYISQEASDEDPPSSSPKGDDDEDEDDDEFSFYSYQSRPPDDDDDDDDDDELTDPCKASFLQPCDTEEWIHTDPGSFPMEDGAKEEEEESLPSETDIDMYTSHLEDYTIQSDNENDNEEENENEEEEEEEHEEGLIDYDNEDNDEDTQRWISMFGEAPSKCHSNSNSPTENHETPETHNHNNDEEEEEKEEEEDLGLEDYFTKLQQTRPRTSPPPSSDQRSTSPIDDRYALDPQGDDDEEEDEVLSKFYANPQDTESTHTHTHTHRRTLDRDPAIERSLPSPSKSKSKSSLSEKDTPPKDGLQEQRHQQKLKIKQMAHAYKATEDESDFETLRRILYGGITTLSSPTAEVVPTISAQALQAFDSLDTLAAEDAAEKASSLLGGSEFLPGLGWDAKRLQLMGQTLLVGTKTGMQQSLKVLGVKSVEMEQSTTKTSKPSNVVVVEEEGDDVSRAEDQAYEDTFEQLLNGSTTSPDPDEGTPSESIEHLPSLSSQDLAELMPSSSDTQVNHSHSHSTEVATETIVSALVQDPTLQIISSSNLDEDHDSSLGGGLMMGEFNSEKGGMEITPLDDDDTHTHVLRENNRPIEMVSGEGHVGLFESIQEVGALLERETVSPESSFPRTSSIISGVSSVAREEWKVQQSMGGLLEELQRVEDTAPSTSTKDWWKGVEERDAQRQTAMEQPQKSSPNNLEETPTHLADSLSQLSLAPPSNTVLPHWDKSNYSQTPVHTNTKTAKLLVEQRSSEWHKNERLEHDHGTPSKGTFGEGIEHAPEIPSTLDPRKKPSPNPSPPKKRLSKRLSETFLCVGAMQCLEDPSIINNGEDVVVEEDGIRTPPRTSTSLFDYTVPTPKAKNGPLSVVRTASPPEEMNLNASPYKYPRRHRRNLTHPPPLYQTPPTLQPSPLETALWRCASIVPWVLSYLGNPVDVCHWKCLNVYCHRIVQEQEQAMMKAAVRTGGLEKDMRNKFWTWMTLVKCQDRRWWIRHGPKEDPGRREWEDRYGDMDEDVKEEEEEEEEMVDVIPESPKVDYSFAEWEAMGRRSKWATLIERDVVRSFGNLPPHKLNARFRADSIVRALITWGKNRWSRRRKGENGVTRTPTRYLSSTHHQGGHGEEDIANEDEAPIDTVSDWGGISQSFDTAPMMDHDHSSVKELALGGNTLSTDVKMIMQEKLGKILYALAAVYPEVGYCQGMDYIVAHLLRVILGGGSTHWKYHGFQECHHYYDGLRVEETVFRVMKTLFSTYNLRHMFMPQLRCLKRCCRIFEYLIKLKLPVLADHFDHYDLNVGLFALGWFQTLFLYLPSMPSATVCHMWDIWLVERSFKIFYRVGTAILYLSQPILLNHELEGMMTYLNTFPDVTLLRPDILIACALQIKVTNRMLMNIEMGIAAQD